MTRFISFRDCEAHIFHGREVFYAEEGVYWIAWNQKFALYVIEIMRCADIIILAETNGKCWTFS